MKIKKKNVILSDKKSHRLSSVRNYTSENIVHFIKSYHTWERL